MIFVLGVDPGVKTGVSVVSSDLELEYHLIIHDDFDLNDIMEDIVAIGVTQAYIEDQFVGQNKMGAIKLAHRAGVWHGLCIANDIDVTLVAPQKWQCAELGCSSRAPRKERKRLAIERCLGLWDKKLQSDVADAALLARYGAVELVRQEKLRRLQK